MKKLLILIPETYCTSKLPPLGEKIQGIKICRNTPSITRLLFADQYHNLIFLNVELNNFQNFKSILEVYEKASGKKIIFKKSSILFSPNCDMNTKNTIMNLLQIKSIAFNKKYLGLHCKARMKTIPSRISRKGFGGKLRDGRKNCFPNHVKNS